MRRAIAAMQECKCGAAKCSGFLGVKPLKEPSPAPLLPASITARRPAAARQSAHSRRKRRHLGEGRAARSAERTASRLLDGSAGAADSESECYLCGDGGELIVCDGLGCGKASRPRPPSQQ